MADNQEKVITPKESQSHADFSRTENNSSPWLPEEPLDFSQRLHSDIYSGKETVSPAVAFWRNKRVEEILEADRAYLAGEELRDTIARTQWITPKEFIDYVQDRAGVGSHLAQVVFHSLESQVDMEHVLGVGVRNVEVTEDFDNSRLEKVKAQDSNQARTPFYGGAHFDY